ncbi:MAG: hypothetical protein H7141_02710, partial [Burkholderiales bacterium]|nr:hypothetical protein [Bacteroidia bacterium]
MMFKFLLFIISFSCLNLNSQTIYSWSAFPSGGTSYNTSVGSCSMAVTTSGSQYNTVGNVPRYTNTGTLPSSNDGRDGLFIDQNWTTQTNTTSVVFTFNPPANNPVFTIYDINRTNACSDFCSAQWNDKVIIRTSAGNNINLTSVTPAEHTIIGSGSSNASVEAAVLCLANNANVNVSISGSVTSYTLLYTSAVLNRASSFVGCASPTPSNCVTRLACGSQDPVRQYITISDITGQALSAPTGITGNLNLCTSNSTILTATGGTGTTRWYTGSCGGTLIGTGSSITVSPATSTTYYAANVNCNVPTSCASAVVNVTTTPTANAGSSPANLTCNTTTVSLNGSGGGGYTWSGPSGGISSGGTSANPVVTIGGTYTLVVNSGICNSAISTVAVIQNTVLPVVTTSTTQITCSNATANPGVSTGAPSPSYNWSGTGITSSATISTITVNQTGTFNYTVTNGVNGCKRLGSLIISASTNSPTVSSTSAGTLTCSNLSPNTGVNSPSSPISYNWAGTGITSAANISTITVNQLGIFNYTVTNTSNGCQTFGSTSVTQNTVLPVVSSSASNTITCLVTSVNVNATTTMIPVSYNWTGSGITSASNISTITVNAGGTYNYTVTNTTTGCRTTGSQVVIQNTPTFTVVSVGTNSLNCVVTSAAISASTSASPVTYNWSGPGIVSGNSTPTINVNAGGTYNYTATNTSNGCITVGSYLQSQNTNTITIGSTSSSSLTCTTTTANAIVTPVNTNTSVVWSGPGIVGGNTTPTITVNASGLYTYTVTQNNSLCKSINTVSVGINNAPPTASASLASAITCTSTSATLQGGPLSGVTYSWSGSGLTGATNQSTATITAPGTYTLLTTSTVNGCTNTAVVTPTANLTPPQVSVVPDLTINCSVPTATLSGSSTTSGVTYAWTGPTAGNPAGSTPTSSTSVVNAAGNYTLTVTNPVNGCTSSLALAVTSNITLPSITVGSSQTITCISPTAILTGSSSASPVFYSWTGPTSGNPAGSTPSNSITTINTGGNYTLVVTNSTNSCTNSAVVSITQNTTAPLANATNASTLNCTVITATLTGTGGGAYNWSGPGITSGGTTSNPVVNQGGTYVLTVTAANGCTATANTTITQSTTAPTASATNTSTLNCTMITATLTGTGGGAYNWSGPGITSGGTTSNPVVNQGGTYVLT